MVLMAGLGVVIVSTPQDVALKDTLKGISMFQKMNINVSVYHCPGSILRIVQYH